MSPTLDKNDITRIQQIIGTFLYYSRIVDPTLLVDLIDLATQQTKKTQITVKNMNQLLDYFCGFPKATIRYDQSDMVLKVHSDAGCLNVVGDKEELVVTFIWVINHVKTMIIIEGFSPMTRF